MYSNDNLSFFDIARYLNSLGFKTSYNKPFERRSIEYIVQNPIYCGMIRWNRTKNDTNEIKDKSEWIITDGEHEPIISKELFDKAQTVFKNTYQPKGSRPSSTYKHWLSGMLKCPDCGRTLTAFTKYRRNGDCYSYFSCYGYSKGKCSKPNGISSMVREKEVLKSIKQVLDTGNIEFELRHYKSAEIINERAILKERLKGLSSKEDRIKASYREGIDTLDEYKENKKLIQKEREDIMQQLDELSYDASDTLQNSTDAILKKVHNIYSIISSDQYTCTQKNSALRQIIDKIIYDRLTDTLKIFYFLYQS